MFQDLREFISQSEDIDERRVIEGADWDCEIGAIGSLLSQYPESPLLVFDKIKGYPPGYRVATNLATTERRVALAYGLPPEAKGLELVRAFHMRDLQITQVIRERQVGAPALDEDAGAIIRAALEDWGVNVLLQEEVERFEPADGHVAAITKTGARIECDLVGISVGARPRLELAEAAGLEIDRGILVDRRFRSSSLEVYAAGDVAQAYDHVWGQQRVNTSWRTAREQGEAAGIFMAGGEGEYPGAIGANYQLAAGLPFCAIGISNPPDAGGYDITAEPDLANRTYRKLVRSDGRLVGACFVGELEPAAEAEEEIRQTAAPDAARG